jgi:diguanylate cyclase (GGDEF)-like protein
MEIKQHLENILIVDDTPENLTVLRKILTEHGYRVRPALNGEIALKTVQADLPDLILLDIIMPGMDGYEVCERLKAREDTRDVPIIFISALSEIEDKMRAFSEGGVDYISKPFHAEEILARVDAHLTLRSQQKALAEQNEELKQKNALIREQAEKLKMLASKDFLTGLSNRRDFLEKAQQEERRYKRTKRTFAFILLDIDYFKKVNDTYGHDCGDAVLVEVARSLGKTLRGQDVVARWGGEEFICLLPETDLDGARHVAEKIRESSESAGHRCGSDDIAVTVTLGVSVFDGNFSLEECIGRADKAMYKGKQMGRNRVEIDA